MAVIIVDELAASPDTVSLQSGQAIELKQTLRSDLGGEAATITYSLDGRTGVYFVTPGAPSKTLVVQAQIGGDAAERVDRVVLTEQGDTEMAQVEIRQTIQAETTVEDRVVIGVIDET